MVRIPKRWDRIVEIAAEHIFRLPEEPDSKALEEFLVSDKAAHPVRFPDLSLAVIKLLGSGEYVAEPPDGEAPGHFGLAVKDYGHSTAPNRRYPDLLTQRLLKAAMEGKPAPYNKDDLDVLAAHCTEAEDAATKVERRSENPPLRSYSNQGSESCLIRLSQALLRRVRGSGFSVSLWKASWWMDSRDWMSVNRFGCS